MRKEGVDIDGGTHKDVRAGRGTRCARVAGGGRAKGVMSGHGYEVRHEEICCVERGD